MKKFLTSLFFIFVALVIFIVAGKDMILKAAIDQGVTRVTGFPTRVESVKYNFPSTIHVTGLHIDNPAGFEAKTFVDIPEIYISLVLNDLLKNKMLHLPEVRLNIQEVHIEKNPQGVSNVELLSSVGDKKGEAAKPAPAEKKPAMQFWLEKLNLTIRQVSYQDRSSAVNKVPGVNQLQVGNKISMDLNVKDQVFTDIRDPKVLVNVILVKILNGATLGRLLEIDPQQLMTNTLGSAQQLVGEGVGTLTEGAGKVTGQAKDFVANNEITSKVVDNQVTQKTGAILKTSGAEAQQALGSATSAAKSKVSGLLGKVKSIGENSEAQPSASPSPAV